MHIFISYAKIDTRDLALRLRERLQSLPGVTAWMDESLEVASSWAAQIQAEIDRADFIVVLLSPDVNRMPTPERARSFVLNEIDYAQQLNKTIVPVMAQPTRMPVQLAGIQYIDMTRDEEAGIQRLITRITRPTRPSTTSPTAVPAPPLTRRVNPVYVLGGGLAVIVALIAVIWALRPPPDPNTVVTLTPNFETQAALLATDIVLTERAARVTVTPTPNATDILATLIANIVASETARAQATTVNATSTAQAMVIEATRTMIAATESANAAQTQLANVQATRTQEIVEATAARETQLSQAAQNEATNTPLPTSTPTEQSTASPTPTATGTATATSQPTPTPNPTEQAQQQAQSATEVYELALATASAQMLEQMRVQIAALNITAAFEGVSYDAYSSGGPNIVTYGRFNYSLAGGSLEVVIDEYLDTAIDSEIAEEIHDDYRNRIHDKDATLANDDRFRDLLVDAADEFAMQYAQDQVAIEQYWNVVQELSVAPRGITSPLGQAMLFDIAIQFGPRHAYLTLAEEALGVEPRSAVGTNGITEEQLITKVAELRRDSLYRIADRDNRPWLKDRADFWLRLIEEGDWQLRGDENGLIEIRPDVVVDVMSPVSGPPGIQ